MCANKTLTHVHKVMCTRLMEQTIEKNLFINCQQTMQHMNNGGWQHGAPAEQGMEQGRNPQDILLLGNSKWDKLMVVACVFFQNVEEKV